MYRATFYPPGGGPPVAAVVKEGGLRWPPPAPGERGVGFAPAAPPSRQRLAAEAMFLEQAQEALLTELLGSDSDDGDGDDDGDDGGGATQPRRPPPVPRQLGACLSASYLLATSVTARARPLRGGADWAGLAAGAAPATAAGRAAAALGLARAAASLFRTLAEVRHLRLDDLHWDAYGADGRVRTNFSGFGGNAYPQDDLSQFGVSPAPCAAPLGCWALQLLDADKVAVSHDAEARGRGHDWGLSRQPPPLPTLLPHFQSLC